MALDPWQGFALRLRNLAGYLRDLGLAGTAALLAQRRHRGKLWILRTRRVRTPFLCRKDSCDLAVVRRNLGAGEPLVPLERPRLIIDAGAHVGTAAVLYAAAFPQAAVIAVEPNAENHRFLRRNLRPYPRAVALRGALWAAAGHVRIQNPESASVGFRVTPCAPDASSSVRAYTVKELLAFSKLERIDLLKLDIEGSERELFSSDPEAWLPFVDHLVIEVHEDLAPGAAAAIARAMAPDEWTPGRQGEYDVYHRRRPPG